MKHGFSLVELSIVLVILGLLTGGILTGQSLIRAAELRSITTEFQSYQAAVNTFRDKYFALPGDMRNAEDFWGTMVTGTCPNATAGTGTQTCNGDGDGVLEPSGAASQSNEYFTFWQHLANAGLIEGSYTGISGASGIDHHVIGSNIPRAKLSNAGWSTGANLVATPGSAILYAGITLNNFLNYGAAVAGERTYGKLLLPEEAWNIDTKIDDGKPTTGKVISLTWWGTCTDATANNDLDSAYLLTSSNIECSLYFPDVF